MANIDITLYDNFNYDFDEYKEMYIDCNCDEDEDVEEISDSTIWDYIYDCLDMEWDDLRLNIKHSKIADTPCVIVGNLGLWTGRHDIEPTTCDNLWAAIQKCVKNMDYVIVKQVCGHIEVTGIHHDGRNTFEIHLLNNKGISASDRIAEGWGKANLENRTYHKAIKGYIF